MRDGSADRSRVRLESELAGPPAGAAGGRLRAENSLFTRTQPILVNPVTVAHAGNPAPRRVDDGAGEDTSIPHDIHDDPPAGAQPGDLSGRPDRWQRWQQVDVA